MVKIVSDPVKTIGHIPTDRLQEHIDAAEQRAEYHASRGDNFGATISRNYARTLKEHYNLCNSVKEYYNEKAKKPVLAGDSKAPRSAGQDEV